MKKEDILKVINSYEELMYKMVTINKMPSKAEIIDEIFNKLNKMQES